MLLKLLLKDIKTHYVTTYVKILLLWLSFGALMMFRFFTWDAYMMHAFLTTAFACSVFLIKERSRNTDMFTCSLPVSRGAVVLARYITCGFISVTGIVIWFGIASIADFLYRTSVTHLVQIANGKVILMALFFLSLHIALFLPAVCTFRLMGVIFFFAISLIITLFTTTMIFHPDSNSFALQTLFADWRVVTSLSLSIIIVLTFSAVLSRYLYLRTDL